MITRGAEGACPGSPPEADWRRGPTPRVSSFAPRATTLRRVHDADRPGAGRPRRELSGLGCPLCRCWSSCFSSRWRRAPSGWSGCSCRTPPPCCHRDCFDGRPLVGVGRASPGPCDRRTCWCALRGSSRGGRVTGRRLIQSRAPRRRAPFGPQASWPGASAGSVLQVAPHRGAAHPLRDAAVERAGAARRAPFRAFGR